MPERTRSLSAATIAMHEAACEAGESGYIDPATGKFVLTSFYLASRGRCCGNGCRHCPWPAAAQRRAGRPVDALSHPWLRSVINGDTPSE